MPNLIAINDVQHALIAALESLPVVEEIPEGMWLPLDGTTHDEWICSNCGNVIVTTYITDEIIDYKYCHNCGAKMYGFRRRSR